MVIHFVGVVSLRKEVQAAPGSFWYAAPKCTVAESVGHRIVLTLNVFDMSKTVEKARDAGTGRFVTRDYAKSNPKTTVVGKVKVGQTKHRK